MSSTSANDVRRHAIVIGAGPVGCLAALMLAKLGWKVDLYEGRPDIRISRKLGQNLQQRSINLAISSRGIASLHAVDPTIATRFLETAIPMRGRMLHHLARPGISGETESQLYDTHGQCINSIERGLLNAELLDRVTSRPEISLHFEHRLSLIDFKTRIATFVTPYDDDANHPVKVSFDFCIGADGSYSNVRRQMMRVVNMNYEQEYIPHDYIELRMPPGPRNPAASEEDATFLMDANHLHIWPRHSFMLIALPNKDQSFTCTLFAPSAELARLQDPKQTSDEQLLSWFRGYFPDAVDLIGPGAILRDLRSNPRSSLITIKASPYHYQDRALIIGDAAHSMVPFYGQGLNCGLEDVRVLQSILLKHGASGDVNVDLDTSSVDRKLALALEEYSSTRHQDLLAICQLAMNNYVEMRHMVTTPLYKVLRVIDGLLARFTAPHVPLEAITSILSPITSEDSKNKVPFPSNASRGWIPLYTMVTFRPDISYSAAKLRAEMQYQTLRRSSIVVGSLASIGLLGAVILRYASSRR